MDRGESRRGFRAVKVKSKVKKDLRDCGGRLRMVKLTSGQGLNVTGAYQRSDTLTVSCRGWGRGNADNSRVGGEGETQRGIMHHLSDARPVRSRHRTGDTGINDYPNRLG